MVLYDYISLFVQTTLSYIILMFLHITILLLYFILYLSLVHLVLQIQVAIGKREAVECCQFHHCIYIWLFFVQHSNTFNLNQSSCNSSILYHYRICIYYQGPTIEGHKDYCTYNKRLDSSSY